MWLNGKKSSKPKILKQARETSGRSITFLQEPPALALIRQRRTSVNGGWKSTLVPDHVSHFMYQFQRLRQPGEEIHQGNHLISLQIDGMILREQNLKCSTQPWNLELTPKPALLTSNTIHDSSNMIENGPEAASLVQLHQGHATSVRHQKEWDMRFEASHFPPTHLQASK